MQSTHDDEKEGEEADAVTQADDDDSGDWIGNGVKTDDGHKDTKENGGMYFF